MDIVLVLVNPAGHHCSCQRPCCHLHQYNRYLALLLRSAKCQGDEKKRQGSSSNAQPDGSINYGLVIDETTRLRIGSIVA